MGRLFGTDGVRGLANRDLTPELALAVAAAAAQVLPSSGSSGSPGRPDRRWRSWGVTRGPSGEMLEAAVVAGLASAGARRAAGRGRSRPRRSRSSPRSSTPTSVSCCRPATTRCRTTASSCSAGAASSCRTGSRTRSRPCGASGGPADRRRRRPGARCCPTGTELRRPSARHADPPTGRAAARRRLRERRGFGRSRRRSTGGPVREVITICAEPDGLQHQRRLRVDPSGDGRRRGAPGTVPTSGSPTTGTPTAAWPSTADGQTHRRRRDPGDLRDARCTRPVRCARTPSWPP